MREILFPEQLSPTGRDDFFYALILKSLIESNKEISQEVPECYHTDSKEFGHIEVDLKP